MAEYTKTVNGLSLQESFSSFTGWTTESKFSLVTDPTLATFGKLPLDFNGSAIQSAIDDYGSRQPGLFIENGIWYLMYDGPNSKGSGTFQCASHMAVSRDRGLTWSKRFTFGPGFTKGTGGVWKGAAMGRLAKWGSTYYLYRVVWDTVDGGPPYFGDIWTASSLDGTWTYQSILPLTITQWTEYEHLFGDVVKDGSTYHAFNQGRINSTIPYQIGRNSASDPAGPWTLDTTQIITTTNFPAATGWPENPKIFFHSSLNVWVMLFNSFYTTPSFLANLNSHAISSSVTNWTSCKIRQFQRLSPLDGTNCIGVSAHPVGPDGVVVVGSNGFIPITYDNSGQQSTATNVDFAYKRSVSMALLEPSAGCFQYTGTDAATHSVFKTLTNTDFVAEFIIEFLSVTANTNAGFWFRSDGLNSNGYKVIIRNNDTCLIEKYTSSTAVNIAIGTGTQRNALNMLSRVKVVASGANLKVYLDGELQINVNDSTFASGTHIGVFGFGIVNAQFRLLSIRTSEVVTLSGLQPGASIILRADGKFPVTATIANASGLATFTYTHFPLETFEIEGVDYTPVGGIWGGDTYAFTGLPSTNTSGNRRALTRI